MSQEVRIHRRMEKFLKELPKADKKTESFKYYDYNLIFGVASNSDKNLKGRG
jgi:hypothetical protein